GHAGADDRNEARQSDRAAAMAAEEFLGTPQVIHLEQAIAPAERGLTHESPYRVVHRVAGQGGDAEHDEDEWGIESTAGIHCSQRTDAEEQGVAGEERRHDETSL